MLLLPLLFLLSLYQTSITATTTPSTTAAAAAAATTAYDTLQSHGLPKGLLPRGVRDFTVDPTSGRFEAVLDSPCTAKFESEVHYNQSVSGTLSYGEIASLSGVSAQELFLWFPVLGIRVDVPSSGVIYFDVGVVYKRFPLSLFETPPICTPDGSNSRSSLRSLSRSRSRTVFNQEETQRSTL